MRIHFKKCIALLLSLGLTLSASACMMMPNQNTNNTETSQSSKKESSKKDKNSSKKDEEESSDEEIDYSDYVDFVVEVEEGRNARVLQLTDPQLIDYTQAEPGKTSPIYTPDKTEEYCYRYIRQVVERYDPDLILMTGDLVYGQFDNNGSMFTELIDFMEGFDIPWAPVFGNHDNESKMGVDWQCEQLENAENCLFKQRELTGNGNYSVGILQGEKLQRVFFMMDSNGCGEASEES
ncbi:MAG: metallophosphoesterase, partial [Clostridia bacterium]|nr:metallophosphoesterase [Clostridia bacterium]